MGSEGLSLSVCLVYIHNQYMYIYLTHSRTDGPHQQVRVLQRSDEGQVALPRRQHVQEELVQRDGQRLEGGRVAVDELCGGGEVVRGWVSE